MAAIQTQDFFIRPAESLEEVHDLWWPLMQSLEWVRDSSLQRFSPTFSYEASKGPARN